MLWFKEETSQGEETELYVNLFTKTESSGADLSKNTEASCDEQEVRDFVERAKHYNARNDKFAEDIFNEGEQLLSMVEYVKAIKELSRCIYFAKPHSSAIGHAYAKRAICYYHLRMANECMADICMAKSILPYEAVEVMAVQCIKLVDFNIDPIPIIKRPLALSFKEHDKFPGIANCLDIRMNDDHEPYVITKSDLKIGQTILIEQPFSIVPTDFGEEIRDRCYYCFKKADDLHTLQTSKECDVGLYCSDDCALKSYRKFCDVKAFTNAMERIQLVLKTFHVVNDIFENVDDLMKIVQILIDGNDIPDHLTYEQRIFCVLFQLDLFFERYPDEIIKDIKLDAKNAYEILLTADDIKAKYNTEEKCRFVQHFLLHLRYLVEQAVDLHDHARYNDDSVLASYNYGHYAKALYTFGSYIQHSCVPNVCWFTIDDRLVLKVIRPIKKDEQILRSHLNGMESFVRDARVQTSLSKRHYIQCKCKFCWDDIWSPPTNENNLRDDPLWCDGILGIFRRLEEFRCLPLDTIENYEKNAIAFLEKYDDRHPVRDTVSMQECLRILWKEVASMILPSDY